MEPKYNTNLASEFFVMSMLYRKGLDAYLTLGNKKGVDILVKKANGTTLKIEVKGVNKKSDDWPLSSGELSDASDLYFILISYESEIHNLKVPPKVWVVPASIIKSRCKQSPTKTGKYLKYFSHKLIREEFSEYRNNWAPIEE
jgi:hypothetical protein